MINVINEERDNAQQEVITKAQNPATTMLKLQEIEAAREATAEAA